MSTATVHLPTPLRAFCGGAASLTVEGATVGEVLRSMEREHPDLAGRILDDAGEVRRFVNVFVDGANARSNGGAGAPVPDGAELTIVPAVAGGAHRASERRR